MQTTASGQNKILRRLLSNAGSLFAGTAAASIIGFGVLAASANYLGPIEFGSLTILYAASQLIMRVASCQSGSAAIKYGIELIEKNDKKALSNLLTWSLKVEMACAVIAALCALVAVAVAIKGNWLQPKLILPAVAMALTLGANYSSTWSAIFRVCDRFRPLAIQAIIANLCKLALIFFAAVADGGVIGVGLAWAAGDMAGYIYLATSALLIARERGVLPTRMVTALQEQAHPRIPGLTRFVVTTSFHSTVKSGLKEVDVVLVGAAIGPIAAGTYRIAKQLGSIITRGTDPLYYAVYPELSRFSAQSDMRSFSSLILRTAAIAMAITIPLISAFYFFGPWIVELAFGSEFDAVVKPTLIYLIGVSFGAITVALHPASLALGAASYSFLSLALSTALYLILLWILSSDHGVVGASWAFVCFYTSWTLMMLPGIVYNIRRKRLETGLG